MVVNKLRDRYRVDLVGLQASCEANYARLMRLLPDMRNEPEARRIAVTCVVAAACVELAVLEWVWWFNHRRLLEPLGYLPPAEYEEAFRRREGQALEAVLN